MTRVKLSESSRHVPVNNTTRLLSLDEYNKRVIAFGAAEEKSLLPEWTHIPIGIGTPLAIGAVMLAIEKAGLVTSYWTTVYWCGGIIVASTVFGVAGLFRKVHRRDKLSRKLGLSCASCEALLVTPVPGHDDPVADAVRESGRCPRCAHKVLSQAL